jgi:hypothetical protein
MSTFAVLLAEIGWNPEIRNVLSVLVGLGVLVGSVYLLVGSNTGARTGALITAACLTGWVMTMAGIWWLYGIGLKGREATWHAIELNYSVDGYHDLDEAQTVPVRGLAGLDQVDTAQQIIDEHPELVDEILPAGLSETTRAARAELITLGQILEASDARVSRGEPGVLDEQALEEQVGGWRLLSQSDRSRGDAVAASDAFLGPDARNLFEKSSDYSVRDVFTIGGRDIKSDACVYCLSAIVYKLDQTVSVRVPTQYAVVQVQEVVPECEDGQEPADQVCYEVDLNAEAPTPILKEGAPTISVVLVRDLGILRVPSIIIFFISGALFLLSVTTLHRRDKKIAAVRAA